MKLFYASFYTTLAIIIFFAFRVNLLEEYLLLGLSLLLALTFLLSYKTFIPQTIILRTAWDWLLEIAIKAPGITPPDQCTRRSGRTIAGGRLFAGAATASPTTEAIEGQSPGRGLRSPLNPGDFADRPVSMK